MSVEELRTLLETRLRTLQAQQQQAVAQANAATGAIELCTQLLEALTPPRDTPPGA
jgi:porphobilinogen deaminase